VRGCQGSSCVQTNADAKSWDYMKRNLQQRCSLTGFLPVHCATLAVVPINEIFRVRQASQIKENYFASPLSGPFCSIIAQAVVLVPLKG